MNRDDRIFVAGHRGLVGSAIVRRLESEGYQRVLTATREQLDLRDQAAVIDEMMDTRGYTRESFLAAALKGL